MLFCHPEMGAFNRLLIPLLTFFLGIIIAAGTTTLILAHGGDANLIHGCVKNSNGDIRIVVANGVCNSNETSLDWVKASIFSTYPVCPNCDLTNKTLDGLDLTRAYFVDARLTGMNLSNLIFREANFRGADLSNADLTGANLTLTTFAGSNLSSAILSSANLIESNLGGSNLTNANFTGADLSNSILSGTILQGSKFTNAIFAGADFGAVDATGVGLRGVQWNGAQVVNTNFSNADLTGSLNFDTTDRTNVMWSNTICPDGTNSDNNGGTCEGHFTP